MIGKVKTRIFAVVIIAMILFSMIPQTAFTAYADIPGHIILKDHCKCTALWNHSGKGD